MGGRQAAVGCGRIGPHTDGRRGKQRPSADAAGGLAEVCEQELTARQRVPPGQLAPGDRLHLPGPVQHALQPVLSITVLVIASC